MLEHNTNAWQYQTILNIVYIFLQRLRIEYSYQGYWKCLWIQRFVKYNNLLLVINHLVHKTYVLRVLNALVFVSISSILDIVVEIVLVVGHSDFKSKNVYGLQEISFC